MVPRPLSNPPNPWLSTEVEYLEEIPPAEQQTARWLAEFQKAEVEKWVPLVKAAKVKTD